MLRDFLLSFIPPKLRKDTIWVDPNGGGFIDSLVKVLEPFAGDLDTLRTLWDEKLSDSSSRIILEDRDSDRFLTSQLSPYLTQDAGTLNNILTALQELKGTYQGLKMLAGILGAKDILVLDSDYRYPATGCETPLRYGAQLGYGDYRNHYGYPTGYFSGCQTCEFNFHETYRTHSGLVEFGSGLSFGDSRLLYGQLDDNYAPCPTELTYNKPDQFYGNEEYGSNSVYGHITGYGSHNLAYGAGRDECDRCIPNCGVVLEIFLYPDAPFDDGRKHILKNIFKSYLHVCVNVLATYFGLRFYEAIVPVEGSVGFAVDSEPTLEVQENYQVQANVDVYGYPLTYGTGSVYS